jgi:WD40 repeat protein
LQEQAVLVLMDHPHIAKVFDAGATETGRPYFVMEYIPGRPVTEYCDRARLPIDARLELFRQVCDAIHHAHQKGIIHRDIKPSNILVADQDGQAAPKVIDFGVAKALDSRHAGMTALTQVGTLLGTYEYMSPEQATFYARNVDTRSDIYSLGALLYEMVCGCPPHDPRRLAEAGLDGIFRIIREEEPRRPSSQVAVADPLSSIFAARRTEHHRLVAMMRRDLDWVVMKALEKEPQRRYQTASELRDDVRRYLHKEPVAASPPSTVYHLRKFMARNRFMAAAILIVMASLLLGIVGGAIGLLKARRSSRKMLDQLYSLNMQIAGESLASGDLGPVETLLDEYRGTERCRWEWHYLDRQVARVRRAEIGVMPFAIYRLAVSPDERWIAISHPDTHIVSLYDRRDGSVETLGLAPSTMWNPTFAAFSTDSQHVVFPSDDGTSLVIRHLDSNEQRILFDAGDGDHVTRACFSPDGRAVVVDSVDRGIVVIWLDGSSPYVNLGTIPFRQNELGIAFNKQGTRFALGDSKGTVHLWSYPELEKIAELSEPTAEVHALSFSPDGRWLGSASSDGMVHIWDVESMALLHRVKPGVDEMRTIAFSPCGKYLAAGGRDRVITIWSLPEMEVIDRIAGYGGMYALQFSDRGTLYHGGLFSKLVAWNIDDLGQTRVRTGDKWVADLAIHPRGTRLAATIQYQQGPQFQIWSIGAGRPARLVNIPLPILAKAMAVNAQGDLLLGSRNSMQLLRVDFSSGKLAEDLIDLGTGDDAIFTMEYAPNDRHLAIGTENGSIMLWDVVRSELLWKATVGEREVTQIAFSRDGSRILAGTWAGNLSYLDARTGESLHEFDKLPRPITTVDIAPDGQILAAGLFSGGSTQRPMNGRACLWDTMSFRLRPLVGSSFQTASLRFLSDHRTLVSCDGDQVLRLIDRETQRARIAIPLSPHIPSTMAISRDERLIAVGCRDGYVLLHSNADPVNASPAASRQNLEHSGSANDE